MLISIASGKGGTGKTTIALMMAGVMPEVTVVDCDVEEPNCHLFLKPQNLEIQEATVMMPRFNDVKCQGCGLCAQQCMFNAITIAGGKPLFFEELCHSCGGCVLSCPYDAITEVIKTVGQIERSRSEILPGITLKTGRLKVGVPSAVPVIRQLRNSEDNLRKGSHTILDCPPGTSCAMVSAVKDSDYCILVTEPTLFGKHDLELALNIAAVLNLKTGVVINKCDGSVYEQDIEELCESKNTDLLAKIPHSVDFARQYARGIISKEFMDAAQNIWAKIQGGEIA